MRTIKVLVKKVGEPFKLMEIEDTLENMQGLVGGYLEVFKLKNCTSTMWINEEGKLMNLPINFWVPGDVIVGDVFFTGADEQGDIASITDEQVVEVLRYFGL